MGIFFGKRNQWLKVIEWSDKTQGTMVYHYPIDGDQIMFGSKLTVRESQCAIFMNKGKIADVFAPGLYTLSASNLPILSKLLALPYGFKSPFHADVFYVNTKQFTNMKWGTSNPLTMRDKDFGTIRVRAFGSYAFRITDPASFLREVCGTNAIYSTEDISSYLRSMLVSKITDTIAESKVGALDIASNLEEFGGLVKEHIITAFGPLGLTLTNFVVENVSFPEAVEKAIDERSSMGVMADQMDTYVKYQSAKAITEAAKNQGMGGAGASIGTGIALGNVISETINTAKAQSKPAAAATSKKFCPECGAELSKNAKFCSECGHKFAPATKTCSECGAQMKATAKFCPECGKKV